MKSNLNKAEFKKRLTELTSKEKDLYFFTPYNSSGTPFCGTYDESTFELTRNSFWRATKTITIKGEYKELDKNATEVTYEVGWTKFMTNLFIAFISIAFVGINTVILINRDNFGFPLQSVLLTFNGFLIFGCIWVRGVNWVLKKIVNQRFKVEFEIGVEDEWEKLASSNV